MILIKMKIPKDVFLSLCRQSNEKWYKTPGWKYTHDECKKLRLQLFGKTIKAEFNNFYNPNIPML